MKQPPAFSAELLRLCGQHRDQSLTDAEARRLSELIVEQPEARQFYTHFMTVAAALEARLPKEAEQPQDSASDESVDLLLELLQMEQQAESRLVHTTDPLARPSSSEEMLLLLKDAGAVKALAGFAIRSKPARYLAAAAVVLLGLSLLIVLYTSGSGDGDAVEAPAVVLTPDSREPSITQGPAVARLTAQTAPRWAAALDTTQPNIGDALYPGQRFTLSHGFAEVTTSRGAIARIQAPASFELIDHDNAIRLHTGKMVGICETESSKGFLVRTPHMDITDLGTRFGVDASRDDVTEVHVIEGEIKVARPNASTEATPIEQVLTASQAVVARADALELTTVRPDLPRFASIVQAQAPPQIAQLAGSVRAVSSADFIAKPVELWPASSDAKLFREFTGRLSQEIEVDLVEPGNYLQIPSGQVQDKRLPAGTVLHSYILVKRQIPDNEQANPVMGSVTFDQEVIGIIIQQATADAFTQALSPAQLFTPSDNGWLNVDHVEDALVLSADRRTVHFAFETRQATDTIRVLVRAEGSETRP